MTDLETGSPVGELVEPVAELVEPVAELSEGRWLSCPKAGG